MLSEAAADEVGALRRDCACTPGVGGGKDILPETVRQEAGITITSSEKVREGVRALCL